MSNGKRIELGLAELIVEKVAGAIKPVCQRIEVAGSIRRQRATVGDVEIVCIPNFMPALFDMKTYDTPAIQCALSGAGFVRQIGGDKYIKCTYNGLQVDVFIASPETWGCIFTIRTGSADFAKKLVTPKKWGGFCPSCLCFKDGRIWNSTNGEVLITPEEIDVFDALGLAYIPPEKRN